MEKDSLFSTSLWWENKGSFFFFRKNLERSDEELYKITKNIVQKLSKMASGFKKYERTFVKSHIYWK